MSIQGTVFGFVFVRDTGTLLDPATGSSLVGGCPNACILQMNAGAAVYGAVVWLLDAGSLRSRAGAALRTLRARAAA